MQENYKLPKWSMCFVLGYFSVILPNTNIYIGEMMSGAAHFRNKVNDRNSKGT